CGAHRRPGAPWRAGRHAGATRARPRRGWRADAAAAAQTRAGASKERREVRRQRQQSPTQGTMAHAGATMMSDDRQPRRSGALTADEHELWSHVTRSIAPLRRRRPVLNAEPAVEEPPPQPARPATPVPESRTLAPRPLPRPPGLAPIDRRLKQKLARGREAIDRTIDLHGRTQAEAHAALVRFLRNARADGARLVLVITGKGGRSDDFTV